MIRKITKSNSLLSESKTSINNKAFTLIELMVVVSILSMLSSVVLSGVQKSRVKANNAKYALELQNLRTAILIYKDNNNQILPPCPSPLTTGASPFQCHDFGSFTWLAEALKPVVDAGYISNVPHYSGSSVWWLGKPWAYAVYQPNVYNYSGMAATEFSCTPVEYSNWVIGSLPGVILINTDQELPLTLGYTQCDSVGVCQHNVSVTGTYVYCLSLDY